MASRQDEKVDYFTALPPELVLHVIFNLKLKDFLPCMAVSRAWHRVLSRMEPYWKRACVFQLGLSNEMVAQLLASHSSHRQVLFAILKHRHSICDFPLTHRQQSSRYPYNMHYVCQYARGRHLVGTVYKDFKPHKILIQRIEGDALETLLTVDPMYPHMAENRIIWAYLYSRFLFCVAASGIWSVHDVTRHGDLLVQWRAESMYDPEVRVACCQECGMVCTGKLMTSSHLEPFWEFRIVEISREPLNSNSTKKTKLPLPKITRFRLRVDNKEITPRRIGLGKKKIALLSQSMGINEHNFCSSHLLLAQWTNEILGYVVYYRKDGNQSKLHISPTVVRRYIIPCDRSNYDRVIMKNHGLNSEFVLSEDNILIGTIFHSCLATWEVISSNQLSFVEISLKSYQYEEIKLISLGHIYSIIGLEFDGSILVVANRTGEQLLKHSGFAENCRHMYPPYIIFFSSVEEKWSSDIAQPCRTMVVYWNKSKSAVEGVNLGEPSSVYGQADVANNKEKKKQWWHKF